MGRCNTIITNCNSICFIFCGKAVVLTCFVSLFMTWPYCKVNKPGPSTNMPLPTPKLYHNDPPKMGWPLKTRSRTKKNGKEFDILYYLAMLCFAIKYLVNYLLSNPGLRFTKVETLLR